MAAVALAAAGCGGTPRAGDTGWSPGQDAGLIPDTIDAALCDQSAVDPAALPCTPGAARQCQSSAWSPGCGAPPRRFCLPSPDASAGTCVAYGSDAGANVVPDGGSTRPDGAPPNESCNQLVADYAAAVSAARACTPGAPNQSQMFVLTTVYQCGACPTFGTVNGGPDVDYSLDNAWSRWSYQCALCPEPTCSRPFVPAGVCVAVDGGGPAGGVCVPGTAPPG